MAYVVGLTGGIGSGKSLIANLFNQLNIDIVDADIIAREILQQDPLLLQQIIEHFGDEVCLTDGSLNRALLRQKIFNDKKEKDWLNQLLHPRIHAEILKKINMSKSAYVLLVAPLLIENNLTTFCDRVVVVDVAPETQLQRTIARDNNSAELVQRIMQAQVSRKDRLAVANDIINNDPPLSDNLLNLEKNILKLHRSFLNFAKEKENAKYI